MIPLNFKDAIGNIHVINYSLNICIKHWERQNSTTAVLHTTVKLGLHLSRDSGVMGKKIQLRHMHALEQK